jgi:hypothetical protein
MADKPNDLKDGLLTLRDGTKRIVTVASKFHKVGGLGTVDDPDKYEYLNVTSPRSGSEISPAVFTGRAKTPKDGKPRTVKFPVSKDAIKKLRKDGKATVDGVEYTGNVSPQTPVPFA